MADRVEGATSPAHDKDDLAALAKGGRTNVMGFLLRLGARVPFLLIASRLYGADILGRFAIAVLVIEFGAQLATMGLKRGLAEQLAAGKRPEAHIVYDALLLTLGTALLAALFLAVFPQAMFPNSQIYGLDRLLPFTIVMIAMADVALAASAFKFDIAATVRARSVVEPWAISIAAGALWFYSRRDGLILSYVVSMAAAFATALWPLARHYGSPAGWRPRPALIWHMARRNLPLAAADAIEWGTRRIDLWILGLFTSPYAAGIYYVAQQFASLPQKLKTSFEPILGPVITRNIAEDNRRAIADQASQVGFWIIAAQVGVALALSIPGEAIMGVMGPKFVSGTAALVFLLAAEVTAAPAVVSEAALVYMARKRNVLISIGTISLQAALTLGFILVARQYRLPEMWIAATAALALAIALLVGSAVKSRFLSRLTGAPIRMWRPSLLVAAGTAAGVGILFAMLPQWLEWAELSIGIPAILLSYGLVLWRFGFGPDDRALFRRQQPAFASA